MSDNYNDNLGMIKLYLSIGESSSYLGVSTKTMRRWEKKEIVIPEYRTVGGHRRYAIATIINFQEQLLHRTWKDRKKKIGDNYCKKQVVKDKNQKKGVNKLKRAIVYGRVSKRTQKEDLERQPQTLQDQAIKDGFTIIGTYKDIVSGAQ